MAQTAKTSNAGRPLGRRNNATLAREAIAAAASVALRQRFGNRVQDMSPLEVLLAIMRELFMAGDLEGAMSAAALALPYTHERKGIAQPDDSAGPTADEITNDADPEVMVR